MDPTDIAERATSLLNKRITDEVFLTIQRDPQLMHDYLRAVEKNGLDTVNRIIGKHIKEKYHLKNADRAKKPQSTLIQTHQKFD
jgi:hypothetical protein